MSDDRQPSLLNAMGMMGMLGLGGIALILGTFVVGFTGVAALATGSVPGWPRVLLGEVPDEVWAGLLVLLGTFEVMAFGVRVMAGLAACGGLGGLIGAALHAWLGW